MARITFRRSNRQHPHHATIWVGVASVIGALGLGLTFTPWTPVQIVGGLCVAICAYIVVSFFKPLPLPPLLGEPPPDMNTLIREDWERVKVARGTSARRGRRAAGKDPATLTPSERLGEFLTEGRLLYQRQAAPRPGFDEVIAVQSDISDWTMRVTKEVKLVAPDFRYDWLEAVRDTAPTVRGFAERLGALEALMSRIKERHGGSS